MAREHNIFRGRGFTLTEVMASVAIVVVVAIGTLGYQFHSVNFSRASEAQITGTRIGQLVLEDWKSTGGDSDYDPTSLGLGFVALATGELSNCKITLDNQTFYIQLIQSNPPSPFYDAVAGVTLSQIRVIVRWRSNYTQGTIGADDPQITLTTYVRRDQAI